MIDTKYEFLIPEFLELMNDIGRHGHQKYGETSFHSRRDRGDFSRGGSPRTQPSEILKHGVNHGREYLADIPHDYFETRHHQLAAMAFNAMMEMYFDKAEGGE